ncbi:DUF2487 family protein [Paenibacillus woosongensis]|uniref:DUF2487 family protein n=1 Tax=Paenibacillus woosongensis TaxID=307580 RepID=A0AA95I098_9BACL|nr:DUF2487 family protein [Paenibacillus woosongensis]WHX47355.1 DUF2487 family protein [Paenibacillus woosongensis]
MKFSEIEAASWEELRPYLDTCLIPVTGLTGSEQPHEVTAALERLRDVMDWIEIPFKGRVVTYPSFQYGRDNILSQINEICHNVKLSGFNYIIVASADVELPAEYIPHADLIVAASEFKEVQGTEASAAVGRKIQQMWQQG